LFFNKITINSLDFRNKIEYLLEIINKEVVMKELKKDFWQGIFTLTVIAPICAYFSRTPAMSMIGGFSVMIFIMAYFKYIK
tara:strand:+ start:5268 stop:5510 length:243 start_codon:yes stop_codon:yes gene_type:complete